MPDPLDDIDLRNLRVGTLARALQLNLPLPPNTVALFDNWPLVVRDVSSYLGRCRIAGGKVHSITIAQVCFQHPPLLREVLIHEICHGVALERWGDTGHSPRWRVLAEHCGVSPTTIAPDVPEEVQRHQADIRMKTQTKPVLRCTKCGHTYNRKKRFARTEGFFYTCHKCNGECEVL